MNTDQAKLEQVCDELLQKGVVDVRFITSESFDSLTAEEKRKEMLYFLNAVNNRDYKLLFSGNLNELRDYLKNN